MPSKGLTPAQIEFLRSFDTPTVCNVIELYRLRPQTAGYMDARIACCYPKLPPMIGYAATATFRAAAPPVNGGEYGSLDEQVARFEELPGPPVVVFQDLDSPTVAATFGEVMCTSYQSFGAVGLITSGAGRDVEQVGSLEFPVFCDQLICSHGYPQIVDVHVPVNVGGLAMAPGALLHGDANGVTDIPDEIATEVGPVCEEFCACEDILLDYCRSGKVTPKGYAEARAELNAAVRKLGERVRKKKLR